MSCNGSTDRHMPYDDRSRVEGIRNQTFCSRKKARGGRKTRRTAWVVAGP